MSLVIGSKYDKAKGLDITAINKLIRAELAEEYPFLKFSVRGEKFSMGCSTSIKVMDTHLEPRSEAARDLEGKVYEIVDQLRMNEVDYMDDYHSTNFYRDVRIVN